MCQVFDLLVETLLRCMNLAAVTACTIAFAGTAISCIRPTHCAHILFIRSNNAVSPETRRTCFCPSRASPSRPTSLLTKLPIVALRKTMHAQSSHGVSCEARAVSQRHVFVVTATRTSDRTSNHTLRSSHDVHHVQHATRSQSITPTSY